MKTIVVLLLGVVCALIQAQGFFEGFAGEPPVEGDQFSDTPVQHAFPSLGGGRFGGIFGSIIGTAKKIIRELAQCTQLKDKDIHSGKQKLISGRRSEECCGLCAEDKTCKGFSWNEWNDGTCYLKTDASEIVDAPGVISGIPKKPEIDNSALEIKVVRGFHWVYDDSGTGADTDLSIWRPQVSRGFHSLGDIAMNSHDVAPASAVSVRARKPDALSSPQRYERVWSDKGSGGDHDAHFWKPIPRAGYTCLGHLWREYGGPPPLDSISCVKSEYVLEGDSVKVWDDKGSGADVDAGVWEARPRGSNALPPNTFISRRSHSLDGRKFFLLNKKFIHGLGFAKEPASNKDWEQMAKLYAPAVWMHSNEKYGPSAVEPFLEATKIVKEDGTKFRELKETIGDHKDLNDNVQPIILRGAPLHAAPMYAAIVNKPEGVRDIVYWFFYPYNRGKFIDVPWWAKINPVIAVISHLLSDWFGDHVGDWEHYTVRFINGHAYQVYLSAHTSGTTLLFDDKTLGATSERSKIIYSAWGSHGLYKSPGSVNYKTIAGVIKLRDETDRGSTWTPHTVKVIWHKKQGEYKAPYEWMNFAGRWGNRKKGCIPKIGECKLGQGPTGPPQKSSMDPTFGKLD